MQLPPPPVITLDARGIAELAAEMQRRGHGVSRRIVLAIAGIPGSGKSTLARALAIQLNRAQPGSAAVLGLDGFHLSNAALQRAGLADRKGSPQTFDARGYFKLLAQLRDPMFAAGLPVYDRSLHEPVYTGRPEDRASTTTRYLITEGNYLLLDALPWTVIDELADVRVLLDTPADTARDWLIRRHIAGGRSVEQAQHWHQHNDLPNTQLVQDHGRHADRIARWPARLSATAEA